jgi:hypothetical protein
LSTTSVVLAVAAFASSKTVCIKDETTTPDVGTFETAIGFPLESNPKTMFALSAEKGIVVAPGDPASVTGIFKDRSIKSDACWASIT